jgi:hypothetical protein
MARRIGRLEAITVSLLARGWLFLTPRLKLAVPDSFCGSEAAGRSLPAVKLAQVDRRWHFSHCPGPCYNFRDRTGTDRDIGHRRADPGGILEPSHGRKLTVGDADLWINSRRRLTDDIV